MRRDRETQATRVRIGSPKPRYLDCVLVVFFVAVFVMSAPMISLWTAPGTPWYTPYLIWLGVIALTALVQRLRHRDEL